MDVSYHHVDQTGSKPDGGGKTALADFLSPELLAEMEDGEKLMVSASGGFRDYSFVVFPFAKVYEGFLKKLFFQIGAINEFQYKNDRWRVGRALNPQLEKDLRHTESVYDRIVEFCGGVAHENAPSRGQQLAETLWQAWKRGRNQVFHYFPGRSRPLSLVEATEIVAEIKNAMEMALVECKI